MTSLGEFPSLERVIIALAIRDNDALPDCDGETLAENVEMFEGNLLLERNKPNSRCNDLE